MDRIFHEPDWLWHYDFLKMNVQHRTLNIEHRMKTKEHITPASKYSTVVIPVCLPLRRKGAGIQKDTECRIKSGMTGVGY